MFAEAQVTMVFTYVAAELAMVEAEALMMLVAALYARKASPSVLWGWWLHNCTIVGRLEEIDPTIDIDNSASYHLPRSVVKEHDTILS